mmetsp:Transcript_20095/g.45417  ORF Transcript_20095/g.45417 Transcript_20095/m.45417 type:complete len:701 (-) Transcript_20095:35-2137(-)
MQAPAAADSDAREEDPTLVRTYARPMGNTLLVVIMLSMDELNPVKVLSGYLYGYLNETNIACLAFLSFLALCAHERSRLLYYMAKLFFRCSFNNQFFSSVEIVGMEHLPKEGEGPVILTGNHNNQFVDGVLLLSNCHREISFMIAQKSWDRPLVGFLARAFRCIPVARPQDLVSVGTGKILSDGSATVHGEGTLFITQKVQPGDQLAISGQQPVKVKEVLSETELTLEVELEASESATSFKVVPKVDQSAMYDEVYRGLRRGRCLGIFPEGGSHDRTDLLPLKAGVAIIALDAYSKHHIRTPIVPVGLNYFSGHRFGGRVVIEFGSPINIPESLYRQHETDRRGATDALLQMIASAMRSVIVPAPDYASLQQIYMVRRLYVPEGIKLTPEKAQDLHRRFAVAGQRLLNLRTDKERSASGDAAEKLRADSGDAAEATEGERLPQLCASNEDSPGSPRRTSPGAGEEFQVEELRQAEDFREALKDYIATLKRLGIRDHQVRQIGWWSINDLVSRTLFLTVTMALAAIPQLMFNLPVMFVASRFAVAEQAKSLKTSSVKVAARDVVMSYKVIYVLSLVPILFLLYSVLLLIFSGWCTTSIVLAIGSGPFFSFLGTKASEQGVRAYGDIVPLFRRLLPGPRQEQDALPARRASLQRRLHILVKVIGPRLGDLYWQKEVDWQKEMTVTNLGHKVGTPDKSDKKTE